MMGAPQELRVASLDKADVEALKALYQGVASEYQQRLALMVITNKFARTHDLLYITGDTHATAFINGRAFVGAQILKVLNLPMGRLIDQGGNHVEA